jgi:diguanylate cyclase (GGDEF)-like protein/PAS domain S-box-containing protein
LIASGLTIFLAIYAWQQRPAHRAVTFALLMVAVSVWTFATGWGMLRLTESGTFIWAGVISVPVLWLAFSLQFSSQEKWLTPSNILLFSIIPLTSILLMINTQSHHLFFKEIRSVVVTPFLIDDEWVLGPWFWVHMIYSYALILLGDVFILREAVRVSRQYRLQAAALMLGTLILLVVNILFTFKLIPGLEVNYDPLGFTLAGLVLGWGLFRYRLFDLRPIARRLLVDSMSDGMLVIDEQQRIIDLNPAALTILQATADEMVGSSAAALLEPQYDMIDLLQSARDQPCEVHFEKQGDSFVYDLRISAITRQEHTIGHLMVLRDISLRKELENKLQQLAITDPLTDVYNRRYLFDAGENELSRAQRYDKSLAVLMFDIDDFKLINDTHGHRTGDRVLEALATICQYNLRSMDTLARYGGEEFAAILPEIGARQTAQTAERLHKAFEWMEIETAAGALSISISIGASIFNTEEDLTFEHLLQRADKALYQAKAEGKNRVVLQE